MRPHLPMLLAMMPALGCGDDTSTAAVDSSTTGDPGSSIARARAEVAAASLSTPPGTAIRVPN